jgi:hypothetical protein
LEVITVFFLVGNYLFASTHFEPGLTCDVRVIQNTTAMIRDMENSQYFRRSPHIVWEQNRIFVAFPNSPAGEIRKHATQATFQNCGSVSFTLQQHVQKKYANCIRVIKEHHHKEIIVTGKGSGGTVAELFIANLVGTWGTEPAQKNAPRKKNQVKLITYLAHPAGDTMFAHWLEESVGKENLLHFATIFHPNPLRNYCFSGTLVHFSIWRKILHDSMWFFFVPFTCGVLPRPKEETYSRAQDVFMVFLIAFTYFYLKKNNLLPEVHNLLADAHIVPAWQGVQKNYRRAIAGA